MCNFINWACLHLSCTPTNFLGLLNPYLNGEDGCLGPSDDTSHYPGLVLHYEALEPYCTAKGILLWAGQCWFVAYTSSWHDRLHTGRSKVSLDVTVAIFPSIILLDGAICNIRGRRGVPALAQLLHNCLVGESCCTSTIRLLLPCNLSIWKPLDGREFWSTQGSTKMWVWDSTLCTSQPDPSQFTQRVAPASGSPALPGIRAVCASLINSHGL